MTNPGAILKALPSFLLASNSAPTQIAGQETRPCPEEDSSHCLCGQSPGPGNRPATEAGLLLGPKTSLDASRLLEGGSPWALKLWFHFPDALLSKHQQMALVIP